MAPPRASLRPNTKVSTRTHLLIRPSSVPHQRTTLQSNATASSAGFLNQSLLFWVGAVSASESGGGSLATREEEEEDDMLFEGTLFDFLDDDDDAIFGGTHTTRHIHIHIHIHAPSSEVHTRSPNT